LRPVSLDSSARHNRCAAPASKSPLRCSPRARRFVPALSVAGVDAIVTVKVPQPEFDPDTFAAAVGALIKARSPEVVLVAHSVDSFGLCGGARAAQGYGFADRRLQGRAHRRRAGCDRAAAMAKRSASNSIFPAAVPVLLALRASMFKPPMQAAAPQVTAFEAPAAPARARVRSSSS